MKKNLLIAFLLTTVFANAQCYESISFGGTHTVGLKSDGTLWGWGAGSYGQLANVNWTEPNAIPIGINTTWTKVYTGVRNTFAIKGDGTLWVIGSNELGFLGHSYNKFI
ncbi:hypothetical protein [Flavobacterium tegetincola]|uniref:hypothetical protein n=1 Tax=Flavobacterium tegetincola TaxID=150172 RepID=UPI0003FC1CAA|nr:hypothetical protein [Flavobacterium tegetincola]